MTIRQEEIKKILKGLSEDIIGVVCTLDQVISEDVNYHSLGSNYNKKTGLVTIEFEVEK